MDGADPKQSAPRAPLAERGVGAKPPGGIGLRGRAGRRPGNPSVTAAPCHLPLTREADPAQVERPLGEAHLSEVSVQKNVSCPFPTQRAAEDCVGTFLGAEREKIRRKAQGRGEGEDRARRRGEQRALEPRREQPQRDWGSPQPLNGSPSPSIVASG